MWLELAPGSVGEPMAYGGVFMSSPLGLSDFHIYGTGDGCDLLSWLGCFFRSCLLHVDGVPGFCPLALSCPRESAIPPRPPLSPSSAVHPSLFYPSRPEGCDTRPWVMVTAALPPRIFTGRQGWSGAMLQSGKSIRFEKNPGHARLFLPQAYTGQVDR